MRQPTTANGFFVPALVLVFLIVLFIAMLFGTRLLERSAPVDIRYSERYHELNRKEFLDDAERAELELERCRYEPGAGQRSQL